MDEVTYREIKLAFEEGVREIERLRATLDAAEQRAFEMDVHIAHLNGMIERGEVFSHMKKSWADRLAEAGAHLRAVLVVEWDDFQQCPWCFVYKFDNETGDANEHKPDCPRQAAAKWLEERETK